MIYEKLQEIPVALLTIFLGKCLTTPQNHKKDSTEAILQGLFAAKALLILRFDRKTQISPHSPGYAPACLQDLTCRYGTNEPVISLLVLYAAGTQCV